MKSRNLFGIAAVAAAGIAVWLTAPAIQAQQTREKVVVDDVDRTYTVRLPHGYDKEKHYPVMILLHGMGQDSDDMERLTQFDQLADKEGIIAVYPLALHGRWNVGVRPKPQQQMGPGYGRRRYGYPGGGGGGYPGGGYPNGGGNNPNGQQGQNRDDQKKQPETDDVAFFSQMLDDIGTKFSVDSSRVYAAGLSEGGFMSLRLGCALSDRIAAVASVAASMPKTMICLPTRPVPLLMIDGTSDPVVPYGGGTEHNLDLATLSVEDSAKAWAKIDHCGEKPDKSKLDAKGKGSMETRVDTYNGCQQNASVVVYSVKGAGNTWPGGEQYEAENTIGKTDQDLNANELVWKFLGGQKLAEKSAQ